ncbi:MAG: hypothetical protein AB1656_11710, partial [Candidatus Omnitrophota bacterium]
ALANKWNFPDELVHAIRFHHTPEASKNKSILTAIVNLADAIVLELGYGVQLEQMKHPASSYALKIAKIDEELYNSLRDAAEEQISQFASQFIAVED